MSKASGLVLILSGLGVAYYVTPWYLSGADPAVTEQAVAPSFKPTTTPPVRVAAAPDTPRQDAQPAFVPRPAAPGTVTLTQRVDEHAARPLPSVTPFRTTLIPNDPTSLARELQKELKRVGCYDGEVNGVWSPITKKSMKTFTDRVNAALPIEKPDYILLSLVQSHPDKACGKPCPAGQGAADDGRCVPNAILAQAQKKAAPVGGALPPTKVAVASPPPPAPPPARIATATPAPPPARIATVTPAAPPPERTVAAAPAPTAGSTPPPRAQPVIAPTDRPASGWTATTTPAPVEPPSIAAAPPAPGRMALAGPSEEPTPPAAGPAPPGAAPAPPLTAGLTEPPPTAGERKTAPRKGPPPSRSSDRAWMRTVFYPR